MADSDDGTNSRRSSHYNQQRSSLRSDKSMRSPSRPQSAQLITDYTLRESDADPIPPASPSPPPIIPRRKQSLDNGNRTRGDSRGSRRGSRSRAGSRRGSRSGSTGRNIDEFLLPDSSDNLSRLGVLPPVSPEQNRKGRLYQHSTVEEERAESSQSRPAEYGERSNMDDFSLPDTYDNLNELEAPPPIERYRRFTQHSTLEDERAYSRASRRMRGSPSSRGGTPGLFSSITALPTIGDGHFEHRRASRIATELYTISYLILFSILGTLARLGLQALTFYPGAPVSFSELWANVGGTFIMGFLSEDRKLFRQGWGTSSQDKDEDENPDQETARTTHNKLKKTIPLYIGLATGFCGSFTSFSSFIRDIFFALSNDLPSPLNHPGTTSSITSTASRNSGYSVMAILAGIFITISLCHSALRVGAHVAIVLTPYIPVLPFTFLRKVLDRFVVFLAFGVWIGAVIMSIFPPKDTWRGQAVFACAFAPLGCLLRFYASLHLNGIKASFPLGTFCVNVFGTAVLGMAYDLQHLEIGNGLAGGGIIGCQVLQGIMDGFCGCLTTVSTWISEISGLRRRNAYCYAATSVAVGLGVLVIIMGSVRWSVGWIPSACVT
jgi:CrcB protein